MTEVQRQREQRRDGQPPRPGTFAQGDPGRQAPKRQSDAEYIVHHADQQHAVIEQRQGDERQRRPAAGQRAVERERAGTDQDKGQDREDLSGDINVHEPVQHRNDKVDHQIGDDLPIDFVEAGEVGVRIDRVDDMRARQVIDVIGQRRQRMRRNRDRRRRHQHHEQHGDGGRTEIARPLKAVAGSYVLHATPPRLFANDGGEVSRQRLARKASGATKSRGWRHSVRSCETVALCGNAAPNRPPRRRSCRWRRPRRTGFPRSAVEIFWSAGSTALPYRRCRAPEIPTERPPRD